MARYLTKKLPQYLRRIQVAYRTKGNFLGDLLGHARFFCIEDVQYDNWNGGMWGHDVVLFLPLDQLGRIDIDDQADVASELKDKLSKCAAAVDDEWFNAVRFETVDDDDADFRASQAITDAPPVNPDSLSFWKPGLARIFISHRDQQKVEARDLAEALETYGMACFVAHDTIQPMKAWRSEILKGLQTMEVMILFMTDEFEESLFCNQEVGFALGRGVPIIPLKLERKDPPGFTSEVQAVRGQADRPIEAARKLFPLIGEALGREARLKDVLVENFVSAPSFIDAKSRFGLLVTHVKKLDEGQAAKIEDGFRANGQLRGSIYLTNQSRRLLDYMESATGERWEVTDRELRRIKAAPNPLDDDAPF